MTHIEGPNSKSGEDRAPADPPAERRTSRTRPANRSGRSRQAARRTEDLVPFRVAIRVWFTISLQTFGGPAGQIAVMHRALVDEHRWIGPKRFQHALNFCMVLPGPEAQQLAIYIGWLLNGTRGGLAAGTLFVLPGVIAMRSAVGDLRRVRHHHAWSPRCSSDSGAAVLAIVANAVVRVGHPGAGRSRRSSRLAVAAFLSRSRRSGVAFPVVVLTAGVVGWALGRWVPSVFADRPGHTAATAARNR